MSRLSTFLSIFLLITTTSVVLTYAQKVEPTIDPEPINLQYKAIRHPLFEIYFTFYKKILLCNTYVHT